MTLPLPTPDPRARRRLEIGLALLADGQPAEAVDAIRAAIEITPGDVESHYALGQALEAAGGDAAAAYRAALELDPEDRMGAAVRLALIGAAPAPAQLPEAHVRTLFDQYAQHFEASLVDALHYRGPALLRRAVDRIVPEGRLDILDLGCGTGLAGAAFADRRRRLDGIDLSPGMILQAMARNLYDRLEPGEVVAALAGWPERYDLVLAADVAVYIGDLAPLFAAVRAVLRPGGWFALTAESHEGEGWLLGDRHRYLHSPSYLAAVAAATGFAVTEVEAAWARTENGTPLPGWVAVLRAA
ncbi:methyltransferase domain-containing protein [Mycobacterium sp. KBS0706]|uniref:class I SAM-dependent DNA methyltransferase n=1 Tax=Mycobacterium sp. KBS0706 TaxID=2578109 RepID=UPI00110FDA56|nr:methyltransferase [Mycobacterium sp. KBS0706]TSD86640.1 methyltransferase domain-containing protein [Mycobacterium sp. KBS0706]